MEEQALTTDKRSNVIRVIDSETAQLNASNKNGANSGAQGNGLSTNSGKIVDISLHPPKNGKAQESRINVAKLESSNNLDGKAPKPRKMDSGTRCVLIAISSFFCNGIIFGVINSFSLIYEKLQKTLEEQGDPDSNTKAALVGSLTIGTTFLLSPVASIITDKIGIRWTAFLGGVFTTSGMLISSFAVDNIGVLYLSYGVMYGLGAAFTYSPSLAILGHYFEKYLGKVSGFVTAGSSVFTAIMPFLLNYLLNEFDLQISLRFLALFCSMIFVCAFLYESPEKGQSLVAKKPHKIGDSPFKKMLKATINLDNWKKKKYVIWSLAITVSQFGYFVPYVHMSKFIHENFPGQSSNVAVMCIGISSGLGRIIFGFVSDLPNVNRILLQQFSILLIGGMTMLLPITNSYILLLLFILGMGLFDGCFVALLGPIAVDICGSKGAAQAIGFMLGLFSIPLTFGSPITGLIYDKTNSYTPVFLVAGLSPVIGALSMFLIRCVKDDNKTAQQEVETRLAKPAWNCDSTDNEELERKAALASAESLSDENEL